ncbi:MAG TPA: PorT family protein [Bacteroides sp.]|nr:PorT family protein [Bacteroides sp.]
MMKKLFPVLFAAFFLFQPSDAQIFQYGVKAGIGFSSLRFDDINGINDGTQVYNLVTGSAVMGYHLGVQTRVKVAMAYLQPELYFITGGGTVEQVITSGVTAALDVKFSRLDVPLLVGVKLGPARLNLGPVGSFVLSESNELEKLVPDYRVFSKAMTWGFQAGIGVDLLKKISLDARYEGSLSRLGENLTIGGSEFPLDARPRQWLISLGIWF